MTKVFLGLVCLLLTCICQGQKPIIDKDLVGLDGQWPSADGGKISNNGKYGLYVKQGIPSNNSTLVIRAIGAEWQKEIVGVRYADFTEDSRYIVFHAGDSLWQQVAGGDERKCLGAVKSYQLVGKQTEEKLIYQPKDTQEFLIVRDLKTDEERHYTGVKGYIVSPNKNALLLEKAGLQDSSHTTGICWVDCQSGTQTSIWEGRKVGLYEFDGTGERVAFWGNKPGNDPKKKQSLLWYYKGGMKEARALISKEDESMPIGLSLPEESQLIFSRQGDCVFFQLIEEPETLPEAKGVMVEVWHYRDKVLKSQQQGSPNRKRRYWAMVPVEGGKVIRLQQPGENIYWASEGPSDYAIGSIAKDTSSLLQRPIDYTLFILSLKDGTRRILREHLPYNPLGAWISFSPGGQWVLWFDQWKKAWYSYSFKEARPHSISKAIPYPVYNESAYDYASLPPYDRVYQVGIGGWPEGEKKVWLYDDYDIWEVDLAGTAAPVNVTNGFGRQHHQKLRIAWDNEHRVGDESLRILHVGNMLLLTGFDKINKDNAFLQMRVGAIKAPEVLSLSPSVTYVEQSQVDPYAMSNATFLQKATNEKSWLVRRQSEEESPNYFTTGDFKTFTRLSDVQPQRVYNWLTAELIHWPLNKTMEGAGILYKPENFDPHKQYPLIFHYYEQKTDGLHQFIKPELCLDNIEIPYFVSRGYLVFTPDIHYRIGHPGEGALETMVTAARYLMKLPYVDSKHMGIQGHSMGGFETNYIVTHSGLFAAAAESAGVTDMVSLYGSLRLGINGYGVSHHDYCESSQGRMGATLWQHPEWYLENSPILRADHVTTPLLMMHNRADGNVPFMQAVEFFTALQRLGKRVWLLQYDNGSHGVDEDASAKDYTRRLLQFFDHYLKGIPASTWMVEGMRPEDKGRAMGYEMDASREP